MAEPAPAAGAATPPAEDEMNITEKPSPCAVDFELSLLASAARSYRWNTVLLPFPTPCGARTDPAARRALLACLDGLDRCSADTLDVDARETLVFVVFVCCWPLGRALIACLRACQRAQSPAVAPSQETIFSSRMRAGSAGAVLRLCLAWWWPPRVIELTHTGPGAGHTICAAPLHAAAFRLRDSIRNRKQ
jgi:hypothetical protein